MIVKVSINLLKKLCISADEYLYLYLVYKQEHDILNDLPHLNVDVERLQTLQLIKVREGGSHVIKQKFIDSIELPFDQMWSELLSNFPIKVHTTNGVRVLRSKDPMAESNSQAKRKYKRYLNNDLEVHNKVIRGLKNELDIKRKSSSLGYMQLLSTWVNQKTWEKYWDVDITKTDTNEQRITRQL